MKIYLTIATTHWCTSGGALGRNISSQSELVSTYNLHTIVSPKTHGLHVQYIGLKLKLDWVEMVHITV